MLRADLKESIILLMFVGLLGEFLTPLTIGFVVLGVLLIAFQIKPRKLVRNLVAMIVFGSYWFSYGKVIDPEVGLNFLTTIMILKMLEKETLRDQYMIFYGLILLIGSGSLFVRSIMYVGYFTASFFILIQNFYQVLSLRWKIKEAGEVMLWVLPLTAIFFFLIPRLMNPFSYQNFSKREGEIGYTPDVNLSKVESLTANDDPAFRVSTPKVLPQFSLYWRGNILSFTDGWNWPLMAHDRSESPAISIKQFVPPENQTIQTVRVYGKEEFFFGLDRPSHFIVGDKVYTLGDLATMSQRRWQSSQKYKVYSGGTQGEAGLDIQRYSRHHMRKDEVKWVNERFKGTTAGQIEVELRKYFFSEGFVYSLSPGRVPSFLDFMNNKKMGFCSHYSSALALILRVRNVPSRLVSGFMGGAYNRFAGFYLVSQNDAHVWVEAYENGRWRKLDPTSWIAPDRIKEGGSALNMAASADSPLRKMRLNLSFMNDFNQWFEQWDYRFYQWLEEIDYYGQEALLEKFKIKKEWFFTLGPLLLALFMGLYSWNVYFQRKKEETQLTAVEKLWQNFSNKLNRLGLTLPLHSVFEAQIALNNFEHAEKKSILKIFESLVEVSFGSNKSIKIPEIQRALKKL